MTEEKRSLTPGDLRYEVVFRGGTLHIYVKGYAVKVATFAKGIGRTEAEKMVAAINGSTTPSEKRRKLTDEEIQHWAERHDLGPGMTDLRACIEDARSL